LRASREARRVSPSRKRAATIPWTLLARLLAAAVRRAGPDRRRIPRVRRPAAKAVRWTAASAASSYARGCLLTCVNRPHLKRRTPGQTARAGSAGDYVIILTALSSG
jgi:hypothetical protein